MFGFATWFISRNTCNHNNTQQRVGRVDTTLLVASNNRSSSTHSLPRLPSEASQVASRLVRRSPIVGLIVATIAGHILSTAPTLNTPTIGNVDKIEKKILLYVEETPPHG